MKAIDKLTLAELEAIAKRMENAARTIRDAMAVVGGQPVMASTRPLPAGYAHGVAPIPPGPPQPNPLINSEDTDPRVKRPMGAPDIPPKTEAQLEKEAERKLFLESQRARKSAFLTQFEGEGAEGVTQ